MKEVISEGWVGKQKGALQILFERGWIDPMQIQQYTSDGMKETSSIQPNCNVGVTTLIDPTGCKFSIKSLMLLQKDFTNEVTLLQYHAGELGAIVDRSPKCHPEIAGEGIEYAWALSKFFIEDLPFLKKEQRPISDS